ncbi:Hypothetical predicted protein, partial [Pelobates cultripes]
MGVAPEDYPHLRTLVTLLDDQDKDPPLTNLKPRSWYTPNFKEVTNIDLFIQMTCNEIEQLPLDKPIQINNLSHEETRALKELRSNSNLVIKQSDKG